LSSQADSAQSGGPGTPESASAQAAELDAGAAEPNGGPTGPDVDLAAAERMIFFSDAVVAIAMTLLALALPLPTGRTNVQVLHSLAAHRDEYLAFLISFVVIGNHWSSHHRLFRYATGLGGRIFGLNMLWLLMMVITPFTTRVLTGNSGFAVRFTLYAVVQVIASLCMVWMVSELRRYGLLLPQTPESVTRDSRVTDVVVAVLFAISIPVAFFTQAAYFCWIAIPFVLRAARWYTARRDLIASQGA
jgi:uncharacterized membrane protein